MMLISFTRMCVFIKKVKSGDANRTAESAAVDHYPLVINRKQKLPAITLLSEGKGPQEIAEILGCSHNAATIKCCRARKALREKLDEQA